MYDPPSHGDFLGSILGTGIVREKVGDILVQVTSSHQCFYSHDFVHTSPTLTNLYSCTTHMAICVCTCVSSISKIFHFVCHCF